MLLQTRAFFPSHLEKLTINMSVVSVLEQAFRKFLANIAIWSMFSQFFGKPNIKSVM